MCSFQLHFMWYTVKEEKISKRRQIYCGSTMVTIQRINRKKRAPYPVLSQRGRESVMAVEQWKNENNRDLPFFRGERITVDSPAVLSTVMTWGTVIFSGEGCERGKVQRAHGFPAPHCFPDNLSSPEKMLIYEGILDWQLVSDRGWVCPNCWTTTGNNVWRLR